MTYSERIKPKFTIHFYSDDGREEQYTSCNWDDLHNFQPSMDNWTESSITLHLPGMPGIKLDNDYGRWTCWLEKNSRYLHSMERPFLEWKIDNGLWQIIPLED